MHLDTLQISYAVTDPVLQDTDKYPLLYATVPTDILLNRARVKLLEHFRWERVCIISSDLTHHISTSQNLYNELRDTHNETVLLRTFVRGSANALLTDAKNQDLRIFIAIIKESSARNLICQAYNKGLTTARHVWILPGMADPQWWSVNATISNNEDYNCTDEEMLSAINSTIFVDTLQFNTFQDNFQLIDRIYCHVFNQTNECSTELEDIDLHHFLHSKILNAFDATTALALAWNITQFNYTMDELKVLLAQSWKTRTQSHMELVKNLQYNLVNVTSPFFGTANIYEFGKDRNSFGSAMITQFDGTSECILWSYYNGSLDTCNLDICCNATWKGGYQPDDKTCSNGTCTCRDLSNTAIATIVVMIIVFAVGVVATIPLQYVNYWLRKNKYFKSSSPIFNAIITFGCSLQYVCGLLYIANYYIGITGYNRNSLVPLCNITVCFFWLPLIIINSTILMKNWRIFRIFYNPAQKQIDGLSNRFIALGILLFTAPVVLALIVIFSANHYKKYQVDFLSSCPNITMTDVDTFIIEDHCIENLAFHWDGLIACYIFIIFIGITILGCFNCRIPSHYQKEGQLAIFTGSISLILFFTFYAVALFFTNGNQEPARIQSYMPYLTGSLWLYASFILTVLYVPKVSGSYYNMWVID
jgi:gamma-aminobutyric acid type B receptor